MYQPYIQANYRSPSHAIQYQLKKRLEISSGHTKVVALLEHFKRACGPISLSSSRYLAASYLKIKMNTDTQKVDLP